MKGLIILSTLLCQLALAADSSKSNGGNGTTGHGKVIVGQFSMSGKGASSSSNNTSTNEQLINLSLHPRSVMIPKNAGSSSSTSASNNATSGNNNGDNDDFKLESPLDILEQVTSSLFGGGDNNQGSSSTEQIKGTVLKAPLVININYVKGDESTSSTGPNNSPVNRNTNRTGDIENAVNFPNRLASLWDTYHDRSALQFRVVQSSSSAATSGIQSSNVNNANNPELNELKQRDRAQQQEIKLLKRLLDNARNDLNVKGSRTLAYEHPSSSSSSSYGNNGMVNIRLGNNNGNIAIGNNGPIPINVQDSSNLIDSPSSIDEYEMVDLSDQDAANLDNSQINIIPVATNANNNANVLNSNNNGRINVNASDHFIIDIPPSVNEQSALLQQQDLKVLSLFQLCMKSTKIPGTEKIALLQPFTTWFSTSSSLYIDLDHTNISQIQDSSSSGSGGSNSSPSDGMTCDQKRALLKQARYSISSIFPVADYVTNADDFFKADDDSLNINSDNLMPSVAFSSTLKLDRSSASARPETVQFISWFQEQVTRADPIYTELLATRALQRRIYSASKLQSSLKIGSESSASPLFTSTSNDQAEPLTRYYVQNFMPKSSNFLLRWIQLSLSAGLYDSLLPLVLDGIYPGLVVVARGDPNNNNQVQTGLSIEREGRVEKLTAVATLSLDGGGSGGNPNGDQFNILATNNYRDGRQLSPDDAYTLFNQLYSSKSQSSTLSLLQPSIAVALTPALSSASAIDSRITLTNFLTTLSGVLITLLQGISNNLSTVINGDNHLVIILTPMLTFLISFFTMCQQCLSVFTDLITAFKALNDWVTLPASERDSIPFDTASKLIQNAGAYLAQSSTCLRSVLSLLLWVPFYIAGLANAQITPLSPLLTGAIPLLVSGAIEVGYRIFAYVIKGVDPLIPSTVDTYIAVDEFKIKIQDIKNLC